VEALPRGDQVQWRSKVIAERHDKFLQPTFYRLLAVVLAGQEGDFFSRDIGRISGYFARSACQFFISTLPGSLLGIRLLAFPCSGRGVIPAKGVTSKKGAHQTTGPDLFSRPPSRDSRNPQVAAGLLVALFQIERDHEVCA
jgi:hypothetical protein